MACYENVKGYVRDPAGVLHFKAFVCCGAIQGCTAAGFIFALGMDPFLGRLEKSGVKEGKEMPKIEGEAKVEETKASTTKAFSVFLGLGVQQP